jgi:hypothetical protein
MDPGDERLRHQYEQVCASHHAIDEFRGKLLALWPILGGGAGGLALLATDQANERYLSAIGAFGLLVTLGLGIYEWHQSLRCDALKLVARGLEEKMGFPHAQFLSLPSGFRPSTSAKSSGGSKLPKYWIRPGVASWIVYGSAMLGWAGLIVVGIAA